MARRPIRFFVIVFLDYHKRKMALPAAFVERLGSEQLNTAYLSVPTRDGSWPVELVRDRKGIVWMRKGWKEFLTHFSVPHGSFLVFEYHRESRFNLIIMSPSTREISYTPAPVSHSEEVSLGATEITSDESDIDVSNKVMDSVPSCSNKRKGTDHEGQGGDRSEKKPYLNPQEEALGRAEAYVCKNPFFLVVMNKTYVSRSHLNIPTRFASRYLCGREEKTIILQGPDGKTSWSGRYWTGSYALLTAGWRDFATDNRLHVGDVCVFELINVEENRYKVKIFRAYDQEDNDCSTSVERFMANKQPGKKTVQARRGKKQPSASKSFMAKIYPSYLQGGYMHIPLQHSVTYLKDHHDKEATLHRDDGKSWSVMVYLSGSIGRFSAGWRGFVKDNNLQQGDTCTFELVSQRPIHYKVAISRT